MKKLVATLALLSLSNTALAHDIYSTLRDRDGHLCCGGQDCRPVEATVLPDGDYYLPRSDEIIPADMTSPSPDDRFHHCTYDPVANDFDPWGPFWESKRKTRCFFAPMNSSSNAVRTVWNAEAIDISHLGFRPIQKIATIHASSGFIRGIPTYTRHGPR